MIIYGVAIFADRDVMGEFILTGVGRDFVKLFLL